MTMKANSGGQKVWVGHIARIPLLILLPTSSLCLFHIYQVGIAPSSSAQLCQYIQISMQYLIATHGHGPSYFRQKDHGGNESNASTSQSLYNTQFLALALHLLLSPALLSNGVLQGDLIFTVFSERKQVRSGASG